MFEGTINWLFTTKNKQKYIHYVKEASIVHKD